MGYLPPVRNDQYIQYANRSISQNRTTLIYKKPPISQASAPTAKSKKERKIGLPAFRRVEEKKRKKALNRRVAKKTESGRFVNESV